MTSLTVGLLWEVLELPLLPLLVSKQLTNVVKPTLMGLFWIKTKTEALVAPITGSASMANTALAVQNAEVNAHLAMSMEFPSLEPAVLSHNVRSTGTQSTTCALSAKALDTSIRRDWIVTLLYAKI